MKDGACEHTISKEGRASARDIGRGLQSRGLRNARAHRWQAERQSNHRVHRGHRGGP